MDEREIKKFLNEKCLENNIILSKDHVDYFYLYMKNLMEWNKKINLTAIKDEKEIIIKHFIDSIAIKDEVKGRKLLDIGTGAGFPGLPLKILDDNLDITLIDSVNKKVRFVNDTIGLLGLQNALALHIRAEDLAYDSIYREQYDTVVSRAVANLSTLVEYMLPFLKIDGKAICLKGPNCEEEINLAKLAINKLGGRIEKCIEYNIDKNRRCLIIISKVKNTEQIYPRKQGKPLKEPIM